MRENLPSTSVGTFPQSSRSCSVGRFPTEILQEIVTLALGQYLTDILLAPESTRSWDAISILLHVNHCLRCCALKVLNVLWEGTFVDRKTGCVFLSPFKDLAHSSDAGAGERLPRNYMHKVEYLRRLSELARTDPHAVLPPARHVLSMRQSTTAYERLGRSFVVHLARANVYATSAGRASVRFGLFEQDGMSDFARGYSVLPVELRDSMFGGLADYVVGNLLVWVRCKSIHLFTRPFYFGFVSQTTQVIVLRALIDQTVRLRSLIDSATFSEVRPSIFSAYTDHSSQGFVFRTSSFLINGSAKKQRLVSAL
jgi:hypothetical protein